MESPKNRVDEFLKKAGASQFANFFYTSPLSSNVARYSLIIAPNNEAFYRLAESVNNDKKEMLDIVKNHISIKPVKVNGYPTVVAINGFEYGYNINDLKKLEITAINKSLIPGLVIFVVGKYITSSNIEESEEIPDSTIQYWASLPYDIFVNMVLTENISGPDLIALCGSHPIINDKCNNRNQNIFSRLLAKEHGILKDPTPRETYVKLVNSTTLWLSGRSAGILPVHYKAGFLEVPEHKNVKRLASGGSKVAFVDESGMARIRLNNELSRFVGIEGVKQICAGHDYAGVIDKDDNLWITLLRRPWDKPVGSTGSKYYDMFEWREPKIMPQFQGVKSVACGHNHLMFIDKIGQVWGLGSNKDGELGLGAAGYTYYPQMIPGFKNVQQISCGDYHTGFLDEYGRAWMFGANASGQLGLGHTGQRTTPAVIPDFEGLTQISCGGHHNGFLDNRGRLFLFGSNEHHQTGDTGLTHRPVRLGEFTNIKKISLGSAHTGFLDDKGRAWLFGFNTWSQLGHFYGTPKSTVPTMVPGLTKIKQILCTENTTLLLK